MTSHIFVHKLRNIPNNFYGVQKILKYHLKGVQKLKITFRPSNQLFEFLRQKYYDLIRVFCMKIQLFFYILLL